MNWRQFSAIVWLRWRLTVNMWKRGGSLNAIVGGILLALFVLVASLSFFAAVAIGYFLLPDMTSEALLMTWVVVVVLFLFLWLMGLVTELQRSEVLSLEKLLHLPVSLCGAHLLNYLSSWISVTLILFVLTAGGLSVALVWVRGPTMLVLFPLLLGFVVLVTSVSHQFRGWLQILMVNKRRRRTIITLVTGGFILLSQLPNLINLVVQRTRRDEGPGQYELAIEELDEGLHAGRIEADEYARRAEQLRRQRRERRERQQRRKWERAVHGVRWASRIVPVGWLPIGASAAARGNCWPGILGAAGTLLIGAVSLRRSYRMTLKFYMRGFATGRPRKRGDVTGSRPSTAENFLERKLVTLPDQAVAVTLGNVRSLMRGPEGKMLLLTPIFLLGFFSIMLFWRRDQPLPEVTQPFLAIGAVSMVLLAFVQVVCNQFGFDRAGFRSLVLSPCPRHWILLGKNVAIAPLALGVGCAALVLLQLFVALRLSHALASLIQLVSAYLLFCLFGNVVSIAAPSAVVNGALKPAKSRLLIVLVHIFAALLSPMAVMPATVLLGIETLVHQSGWLTFVPFYLLASLVQLIFVVGVYRWLLPLQGRWLHHREQVVLEAVTAKTQ